MSAKYTYGLKGIYVGTADPSTGAVPAMANLTKLGEVYQETCNFNQDDPEITEHREEGVAAPKVVQQSKTLPYITLSLMDPSAAVLASVFGGTPSGDNWGINGDEADVVKSVRLVTKVGLDFGFPNALLTAKMNTTTIGDKTIVLVDVTIRPQAVASGKAFQTLAKAAASSSSSGSQQGA